MDPCPDCHAPVAPGAAFCASCGARLSRTAGQEEVKVVTALFADLTGSTAMGESLDPEVTRELVRDFYRLASRSIEQRDGSVENFAGDAVLGLFGARVVHEDDAARAIDAALAIREEVATLAEAARQRHGVHLGVHSGIETGRAVVGQRFAAGTAAFGDVLNLAARLEEAAPAGEIFVGPRAHRATRYAYDFDSVGSLDLHGKATPVTAWRVRGATLAPPAQVASAMPFTGRADQEGQLLALARRLGRESRPGAATVLGQPGVGKSRLCHEVAGTLEAEGWEVLTGRCLPYGDGITYWPVGEMLRGALAMPNDIAPDEAYEALVRSCPEPEVAARLGFAIGLLPQSPMPSDGVGREIGWALRRWVEWRARARPLALLVEDLHWAEPTLLALLEYVVTWARRSPVLVIGAARPELLESRPAWAAGDYESVRVRLDALSRADSRRLLDALLSPHRLPGPLVERILGRAEGNPLFVEEMVGALVDDGRLVRRDGVWELARAEAEVPVPDSVEALIQSRLDALPRPEKPILQTASVVGRQFRRGELHALGEPEAELDRGLEGLVLRDLVAEDYTDLDTERYRFKHGLVRDVAYESMPKRRKSQLHARFARDLTAASGHPEWAEISAYHLEQAAILETQLRSDAAPGLRAEAVDALVTCGQRVLTRGDGEAAAKFVARCLSLEPDPVRRLEVDSLALLLLRHRQDWIAARREGERLAPLAHAAERPDLEGRALMAQTQGIVNTEGGLAAHRVLTQARTLLVAADDHPYLGVVLMELGNSALWRGDIDAAVASFGEVVELGVRTGRLDLQVRGAMRLGAARHAAGRAEEALRSYEEAMAIAKLAGSPLMLAEVQANSGVLTGLTRSLEEGVDLLTRAVPALEEGGRASDLGWALNDAAYLLTLAGRSGEALPRLDAAREIALELGETGLAAEVERVSALARMQLGQLDQASEHAEAARAHVGDDDHASVPTSLMALGEVRAAQGRDGEAEALLFQAGEYAHAPESGRWELWASLAAYLGRRGQAEQAREWSRRALENARQYGPQSPAVRFVEQRLSAGV
ncbi:MAG: ATP-binding protein [Candidatus Dormibacteria bacterium]